VSNIAHLAAWKRDILLGMATGTYILRVEKDGEDGLIVTFSDGTTGGYVVEELLMMRPIREAVKELVNSKKPPTNVGANSFFSGLSVSRADFGN